MLRSCWNNFISIISLDKLWNYSFVLQIILIIRQIVINEVSYAFFVDVCHFFKIMYIRIETQYNEVEVHAKYSTTWLEQ